MSQQKEYTVFQSVQALYTFVASELKRYSLLPCEQHICLSGGSTPKGLFTFIVDSEFARSIQWQNLHFWWGDERCVAENDAQSNYGEAKRLLFDHIDMTPENIHPIMVNENNITSLAHFSDNLSINLPKQNNYPSFDWVLLGIGDDGHTASLFPQLANMNEKQPAILVLKPNTNEYRISLSANTLRAAKRISYFVSGISKAKIIQEILRDQSKQNAYPASLIASKYGQTEYLLDSQAGSLLVS